MLQEANFRGLDQGSSNGDRELRQRFPEAVCQLDVEGSVMKRVEGNSQISDLADSVYWFRRGEMMIWG